MFAARCVRQGFTLIELIIAIAILVILAGVIGPIVMNQLDKAKVSSTKSNLRSIKSAIDMFKIDTGKYPTKLRDLVEKPREENVAKKWQKGGYLEGGELPRDGWSEDFQYKVTPGGKNPYELYSYGPQGPGSPNSEWHSVWDTE
jgi:general secretion pathway protein G